MTHCGGPTTTAAEEQHANRERAKRWLLPLLSTLSSRGGRVLNIGCGVGSDVIVLHEHGWDAWGVNPRDPDREGMWSEHGVLKTRFAMALGEQLPFRDDSFDICLAFEVLEHVGKLPPHYWTPAPDCQDALRRFARECVRVTKHGGSILLTTPNRWFPIDPGHGFENRLGARVHSPFEDLTLSLGDIRRLFAEHDVTHVPLSRYFRFERSRRIAWRRHAIGMLKGLLAFGDTSIGQRLRLVFPWIAVRVRVHKSRHDP